MSQVTLLVPCYNAAPFLERLMASVRKQTMPFAGIICYDDASTDDTCRVAESLGLNIIRGEINRGPAYARNRLADTVQSEWVHFHDADDLLDPRFVEKMTALLTADVDIAVCQMDWVTESSLKLEIAWRYDGGLLARDPVGANLRNPVGVIACVFRRETLKRIGGFDETLRTWEDADLQVRLSQAGARYRVTPEMLATGMRHRFGASSNVGEMCECRTRLLETYAESLPERYRDVVAAEAEKVAAWLICGKMFPDVADRCLQLCRRLGWDVPSSNHPLLRIARMFLPVRWLIILQARHRGRHAS
jgi:glycosyltransferase involved in cell wall biosynthesis